MLRLLLRFLWVGLIFLFFLAVYRWFMSARAILRKVRRD